MSSTAPVTDMEPFLWIVVIGGIAAFIAAAGIGANDVANAYATSVGSRALTIKQACCLAVIFEFAGAVLAGSQVSDTLRSGIADTKCYQGGFMDSALLMYGNLCVIICVAFWLFLASYLEMPVSTTHSAVGGVIGMTIVQKGGECIVWSKESTVDELYIPTGVIGIVLSWVISPVLSGVFGLTLFLFVRTFVLRSKNAFGRAIKFYPLLIALAVWVNVFFVVSKGVNKKICHDEKKNFLCYTSGDVKGWNALAFAAAVGVGVAILCFPLYQRIKKRVQKEFDDKATDAANLEAANAKKAEVEANVDKFETDEPVAIDANEMVSTTESGWAGKRGAAAYKGARAFVTKGANFDVHESVEHDATVQAIHENAEKFDPMAEAVFRYIQIFTAICDSFAHGANDTANAMGPFMAIYVIYDTGTVSKKSDVGDDAYWILAIGGAGIGIGLLLYGYKIMSAIGVKLAVITPSRGFAIELGAAMVIILGSYIGLPLSTTHCQVGATTGVALLEGSKGINKFVLLKTVLGWVFTLIIVGFTTGLVVAQGIHAPITGNPDEVGSIQYDFLLDECPEFVANEFSWLQYINDTLSPIPGAPIV